MGVNDPHAPTLRRNEFPFAHADYFGALRFRGAIEVPTFFAATEQPFLMFDCRQTQPMPVKDIG